MLRGTEGATVGESMHRGVEALAAHSQHALLAWAGHHSTALRYAEPAEVLAVAEVNRITKRQLKPRCQRVGRNDRFVAVLAN